MKLKFLQLFLFFLIINSATSYAIPVKVGESYGGGTVFCVSNTPDISRCITTGSGEYGLIMANIDQANFDSPAKGMNWSSKYKETNATSNDDGATNTASIIATYPNDNGSNNASWLCRNYRDSEGHTDWYLPSKNELIKMYFYAKNNNLIGKNCTGKKSGRVQCLVGGYNEMCLAYWSSTEYSSGDAWFKQFIDGEQFFVNKVGNYLGVRAIRAFNTSALQLFNNLAKPVMTAEVLYDEIAEMPREVIDIITDYATADISREILERESNNIGRAILDTASRWSDAKRKEAEIVVKEMKVLVEERQANEVKIKEQQEGLSRQEETRKQEVEIKQNVTDQVKSEVKANTRSSSTRSTFETSMSFNRRSQ